MKIKFFGWLTISPSKKSLIQIDPYFSPFGKDQVEIETFPALFKKAAARGWCSWYAFGENINEQKIFKQAQWFCKNRKLVPIEYVQIDDGWTLYGDWQKEDKNKFPHGFKWLTSEIKKMGLKAGIWMAPFLVDLKSETASCHPDWVISDLTGRPVDGRPFSRLLPNFLARKKYLFNYHKTEAYDYLIKSVDYLIRDCGFEFIKIDFLSAPYFDPGLSNTSAADEIVIKILKYIKQTYPEVYTLAGVAPIGVSAGLTNAIRISDDIIVPVIAEKWPFNLFLNRQRIKQLAENLAARKQLSALSVLDPDVFVCRKSLGFSEAQILQLQQIIREAGGFIFLGDDLTCLPRERFKKYVVPLFSA